VSFSCLARAGRTSWRGKHIVKILHRCAERSPRRIGQIIRADQQILTAVLRQRRLPDLDKTGAVTGPGLTAGLVLVDHDPKRLGGADRSKSDRGAAKPPAVRAWPLDGQIENGKADAVNIVAIDLIGRKIEIHMGAAIGIEYLKARLPIGRFQPR